MTNAIRATIAVDRAVDREAVASACGAEPGISVIGYVDARADVLDGLRANADDAILVACAEESADVLAFIEAAVARRPSRPVVVLYDGIANGFVARTFEAGADDLVNASLTEDASALGSQIAFALEKAVVRRGGTSGPADEDATAGELVGVLGPKGGTGKTLVACNLAVAMAEAGTTVALVDLDLQFGDVGLALGLAPEQTSFDLATSGGALDAEKLDDYLATHESGLRVLLAPRRPDQASAISVDFLRRLFATLRTMFDIVVVDTPPSFSPEVIATIDRSTQLCVVAMLDALSLKNTKLALETLELMQVDRSRIHVVLNRADSRVGVTPEDAAQLLGRAPEVLIPSSRDITRSVNEARPIVTGSGNTEARRAFQALARTITPARVPAEGGRAGRGLFRRSKGA